jgi:hypothetical protein
MANVYQRIARMNPEERRLFEQLRSATKKEPGGKITRRKTMSH